MTQPIDFPLETQERNSEVRIKVESDGLIITRFLEGEPQCVMLTSKQVLEIFHHCKGKILGKLTHLHLKVLSDLEQVVASLQDQEILIENLSHGGPLDIYAWIESARAIDDQGIRRPVGTPPNTDEHDKVLDLIHAVMIIANITLKDRGIFEGDPSFDDRYELPDTPPDME